MLRLFSSSLPVSTFKREILLGKASHLWKSLSVFWTHGLEEDSCLKRGRERGKVEAIGEKWEMRERGKQEQETRVRGRKGRLQPFHVWGGSLPSSSPYSFFCWHSPCTNYLKINIIERNNYQNLWNTVKAVLEENICVFLLNTFVRILEQLKVNEFELGIHVKTREKVYQKKSEKKCLRDWR